MDDYNIQSLTDSRNAYTQIFIEKLCPVIIQGFDSIYRDSVKICIDNDEYEKYLMTFQNFLARVPKWNESIINTEVERIKEETNCGYLEDLLTCVHVTQMKLLTNIRVGNKQKKISIKIPELNKFIHNVYIQCARKIYKNVYLFENIDMPLQKQKYKHELETLIKTSILTTIRNNMPIESILKAYLDESSEQEVFDKVEEFEEEEEEEEEEDGEEDGENVSQTKIETLSENILQSNSQNNNEQHDSNSIGVDNKMNTEKSLSIEKDTETENEGTFDITNVNTFENTEANTNKSMEKHNDVKFIGDDISFEADDFTDDDSDFDIGGDNIQIFDDDKQLEDVTDLKIPNANQESEDLNELLNIEEL